MRNFSLLTYTLEDHGLREKTHQKYKYGEMGFHMDSARIQVIIPWGTKHAYRQAQGTRDHITILACHNVAGEDVPTFVIHKGGVSGGGPYNKERVPDALYVKSLAGHIDSGCLGNGLSGTSLLRRSARCAGVQAATCHVWKSAAGSRASLGGQREGIILLCLPPHTSHIFQPSDVTHFQHLKADFSGVAGDLLAVNHLFLVSKKGIFKGPKRPLPEGEGSETGGGWV